MTSTLTFKGLTFALFAVNFCDFKLIPIIYEDFEICVTPEENAGKFDYSELEIIAETDTKVYMNGSWKFLKEVKSPWTSVVFTEKYERGKWNVEMFYKRIPNFCESIQKETEPWYHITKHFEPKSCPFPAGTKFVFNMQSLTEMPVVMPPTMVGKWRMNFLGEFDDEGGKKECVRVYFDLVET